MTHFISFQGSSGPSLLHFEMNSKDVDFSTADLGLKSGIEEEESSDDFDAFNADTFGSEETWHEDDHEEVRDFPVVFGRYY